VSLLWPNQLLVGLSQQSVAIMQLAGPSKRVLQKKYVSIEKPEPSWHQALSQLELMIADKSFPKSKHLHVILASDFVRYLTLPSQGSMMRDDYKVDFARAAYREIYGNAVDVWHIQCDDAAPNQTITAVAVDMALIEALNKLAQTHGMQLDSVQPYLMPVFNRSKSQLSAGQLYFALAESSRLLFASLKNGQLQKIRSFSLEADWRTQLKNILQRVAMSEETGKTHTLMVYAPHDKTSILPQMTGWNLQRINIDSREMQGHGKQYAMLEVA